MSRKKKIIPQDSLELLLDTMCNTFGGVMFISLLLVILISALKNNVVKENERALKGQTPEQIKVEVDSLKIKLQKITDDIKKSEGNFALTLYDELKQKFFDIEKRKKIDELVNKQLIDVKNIAVGVYKKKGTSVGVKQRKELNY